MAHFANWYAKILRLYPRPYYERFGGQMEQTFRDLYREQRELKRGEFGFMFGLFVETAVGIIKEHIHYLTMQSTLKRLAVWALLIAVLEMIPLVARWPWTGSDYMFASVMFFGAALIYELVSRKSRTLMQKLAIAGAVLTPLLLIWINGAVGIIGNENNDANLLYLGVILVEIVGVIVARVQRQPATGALVLTAIVQFLVPFIAMIYWKPTVFETPGIVGVFMINTFFALMFAGSALLFYEANRHKTLSQRAV